MKTSAVVRCPLSEKASPALTGNGKRTTNNDLLSYIGRPWKNGEQDCWTLVRDIYRDHLNIHLPAIVIDCDNLRQVLKAFEDDTNLSPWQPINQPEHLCLVFFTPGHHRATHCGLWLNVMGGRFIHCHRQSGVVFEDRITLEQNGWCNPRFYRHCDNHGLNDNGQ